MWEELVDVAAAESPLWADALLPAGSQRREEVFAPLAPAWHRLGLETIYEGYLVHYGISRLFAPESDDVALLLGDHLYAQGLVRIAETGDVEAVADLAELIALCAQGRAGGHDGDGAAWAATAARLGAGGLDTARDALRLNDDARELEAVARATAGDEAVDAALAAHARLVG